MRIVGGAQSHAWAMIVDLCQVRTTAGLASEHEDAAGKEVQQYIGV